VPLPIIIWKEYATLPVVDAQIADSIGGIQDQDDLVRLYQDWDRNSDGLIGPKEADGLDIASMDVGGTTEETADRPDGYLSPWEIAKARGFDADRVDGLRRLNIFRNTAFGSMALIEDTEMAGLTFKAGTTLEFHPNGKLRRGIVAGDLSSIPGLVIPAGSTLEFNEAGRIRKATPPDGGAMMGNNSAYSSVEFDDHSLTKTLARASVAALPVGRGRSILVDLPAGQRLSFNYGGNFNGMTLDSAATVAGVKCPAGTRMHVNLGRNPSIEIYPADGDELEYGGVAMARAEVEMGSAGSREVFGILSREAEIEMGGRTYSFEDGSYIRMGPRGEVREGRLALEIKSAYGSGFVHKAGKDVRFVDGRIVEGSRECFRAFFPKTELKGDPQGDEIEKVVLGFSAVPGNVRDEVREICVTDRSRIRRDGFKDEIDEKTAAFASADGNAVVLLRDSEKGLEAGTIYHEAAHIHTFELVRAKSRFAGEWIRAAEQGKEYGETVEDKWGVWNDLGADDIERIVDRPRYGCANSYGCTNFWEDVATFMDRLVEGIWDFDELSNPDSPYYQSRGDEREYAHIYHRKLKLLRDYGFITHEAYRKALPLPPEMWLFCQTVSCP
jgi:hypothetical protein